MANTCKPCNTTVFKTLSANPSIQDLIDNGLNNVEVTSVSPFITVNKTTTGNKDTFELDYTPFIPLSINSFTNNLPLQLKGVTVAEFVLSWTYNKAVQTQTLNNGLTAPGLSGLNYTFPVTGQNVTSNITYQLSADDNIGDGNPAKVANTSIVFGNYIYQTQIVIADRNSIDTTIINALNLPTLTKTIKTNRNITFICESDATEYEVLLVPSGFSLTSGGQFKDVNTGFTGGWGKVLDINLTNEASFTEQYGVWVASNKNLNGLTFQII